MIFLSEMFAAFVTAMMLENLLFARAIDIPGLYEKRSPQQILLIGSILMICLGIIGYYIAKIYEEIKDRPRYILADQCGGNDESASGKAV